MRTGTGAEGLVAAELAALGWEILARNVRVGRSELDLVAVDPGPPRTLVVVEVRANRGPAFGRPEESIDWRKLRALYRGALTLRAAGLVSSIESGSGMVRLPHLPLRLDVVSVELGPTLAEGIGGPTLRHLRGVIA